MKTVGFAADMFGVDIDKKVVNAAGGISLCSCSSTIAGVMLTG
jgi:hypothetical protein